MTRLLYLDDTYLFSSSGSVKLIDRDERGVYVVLDQTICYPQGGGQPSDKGVLKIEENEFPLLFVGFHNGDVRHYISGSRLDETLIGKTAIISIAQKNRVENSRLHTGGHLVSHVLETLNDKLVPIKGYHFPDGPYVEFMNDNNIEVGALVESANSMLANDVAASYDVESKLSDHDTIARLRPHLAPFIPKDKPSRIVTIGVYKFLPCGGTHVANLGQLGGVKITKVKKQKSNVRVSYEMGNPSWM